MPKQWEFVLRVVTYQAEYESDLSRWADRAFDMIAWKPEALARTPHEMGDALDEALASTADLSMPNELFGHPHSDALAELSRKLHQGLVRCGEPARLGGVWVPANYDDDPWIRRSAGEVLPAHDTNWWRWVQA